MLKSSIIKCLLALALAGYLIFALSFTSKLAAKDTCKNLEINVLDSIKRGFVTSREIALELGPLHDNIRNVTFDSLNTYDIEKRIMQMDNIEKANCIILNDRSVRLDVTPLIPIARVFDTQGGNYYINRAGKQMKASPRFRMDVPVVIGRFTSRITPMRAFPLLDYLDEHPDLSEMTSAIEVQPNGDLILVPKIRGHVVNLGDTNDLDNKISRLKTFYRKVMPIKGWEYYDTLSLKWRGQLVAKRRNAKPAPTTVLEDPDDIDDVGTMLTTTSPTQP